MNMTEQYVQESLRALRHAPLTPTERHAIAWRADTEAAGRARPANAIPFDWAMRAALRRLGRWLVAGGERLQAWSAAGRSEPQAR